MKATEPPLLEAPPITSISAAMKSGLVGEQKAAAGTTQPTKIIILGSRAEIRKPILKLLEISKNIQRGKNRLCHVIQIGEN